MTDKQPKIYECLNCGFISNRCKTQKFPGISFAICFKCRGKLKERDEWLEWHRERIKEYFAEIGRFGSKQDPIIIDNPDEGVIE